MSLEEAYRNLERYNMDPTKKGETGEDIALQIVRRFAKTNKCVIIHSYKYNLQYKSDGSVLPGNIKYIDGEYVEFTDASYIDEIDLLVLTPKAIIPIEVKARTGVWRAFDDWIKHNNKMEEKSPITQAEKHARHLCALVHEYLPNGDIEYIKPVVVFVDKARVIDGRSDQRKKYIKVTIADFLRSELIKLNKKGDYLINMDLLLEYLMEVGTGTVYK